MFVIYSWSLNIQRGAANIAFHSEYTLNLVLMFALVFSLT
jgi:hypothetical protein